MGRKIDCTLPGHEGEWIERAEEISLGFWKRWRAANDHDETQKQILEVITDWNLTAPNKQPAPKPSEGLVALEAVGINVYYWMVRALAGSVTKDMELSPNESAPSST